MLTPLGLTPSFGFGDRLGLATPGHIAALRAVSSTGSPKTPLAPIFAQQSVRENDRTGRTPQQVLDDARRAVEAADWESPWGADADHLKTIADCPPFIRAGYTFFTVDPGALVDNQADTDPLPVLQEKARGWDWDELTALYLQPDSDAVFAIHDSVTLLRALVKYGAAIQHTIEMYRYLTEQMELFDFEVSVDETDSPTTPFEHYFIANELKRHAVRFTSLAPRFVGRFEKGVDYIGDLTVLDTELAKHAAVTAHFGSYKISLHSGSDKLSVYPLLVKHWGSQVHVKTAGTSYLEALRTLAVVEPDLFRRIFALSQERYPVDRATYHVSAEVAKIPADLTGATLLDNFHAREVLHVAFGSVLQQFEPELKSALARHLPAYQADLEAHFRKHLELLT